MIFNKSLPNHAGPLGSFCGMHIKASGAEADVQTFDTCKPPAPASWSHWTCEYPVGRDGCAVVAAAFVLGLLPCREQLQELTWSTDHLLHVPVISGKADTVSLYFAYFISSSIKPLCHFRYMPSNIVPFLDWHHNILWIFLTRLFLCRT